MANNLTEKPVQGNPANNGQGPIPPNSPARKTGSITAGLRMNSVALDPGAEILKPQVDAGVRRRNRIIIALVVVAFIALIAVSLQRSDLAKQLMHQQKESDTQFQPGEPKFNGNN